MVEVPRHIERGKMQEDLPITPESLYDDNHSDLAKDNREKHEEAKRKRERNAWYRCSDARGKTAGINAVTWGSIAGADEPSLKFAADGSIRNSIAMTHVDGETVIPGEIPFGCTGLGLLSGLDKTANQSGAKRYVVKAVKHRDPLAQSWFSAGMIATLSRKPALAAIQDHLTEQIYPVALFRPQEDGDMDIKTKVDIRDIMDGNYDPKKIYANGIPTISEASLTDDFIKILQENTRENQIIHSLYPNLREMQKIQKPRVIFWSTEIVTMRALYPELVSIPGSCYKVIILREATGGPTQVSDENMERSLDQLELPTTEAVINDGNPSKAFSNTDRLIIHTEDLNLSKKLAQRALREPHIKKWSELEDSKIIVVQAIEGVINDLDYYKP